MSAIVGIVGHDRHAGGSRTALVAKALDAMKRSGPDGTGTWLGQTAAFGHARRAAVPASVGERQPKRAADLIVTSDARLDNRNELISWLGLPPTTADNEIILQAFRKEDLNCVDRFVGPFAFSVWDEKRRRLVCVRDHLGLRPLYYAAGPSGLAFASEMRGIIAPSLAGTTLDEEYLADFLAGYIENEERTVYKEIRRLPRGTILERNADGGIRLRTYWRPEVQPELRLPDDASYAEAFADVFSTSVRCRLRATGPVGTTLSGGLDSACVTGFARHLLENGEAPSLHTFSMIFPELPAHLLPLIDERPYMEAVSTMPGITPHTFRGDQLTPLTALDEIIECQEGPFGAPNAYLDFALYREAAAKGVTTLLDGIEGDLVMSHGEEVLAQLGAERNWPALVAELRAIERNTGHVAERTVFTYAGSALRSADRRHIRAELGVSQVRFLLARLQAQQAERIEKGPGMGLVRRHFAKRTGLLDRLRDLEAVESEPVRNHREAHAQALRRGYVATMLEFVNKNASFHGIDIRHPFFDRRVVEFALSLPASQKIRDGWTRFVQRRAMERFLSKSVCWRAGKASLRPNFQHRIFDERAAIWAILEAGLEKYGEIVDKKMVTHLFKTQGFANLWRFVVLSCWKGKRH